MMQGRTRQGQAGLPTSLRLAVVVAVLATAFTLMPSQAQAGRVVATGHDADNHCQQSSTSPNFGQCHFLTVALIYAASGAPDSAKPLLLLDCSGRLPTAVSRAGATSTRVMCPSGGVWPGARLTTDDYSAIVVGSSLDSINVNESQVNADNPVNLSTPDSNAINARKNDIAAFFNEGGGIVALAGDPNGDGNPANGPDNYYDFLPVTATGKQVQPPFRLTAEGQALGFQDSVNGIGTQNDINCCPTHNSFLEPPAGGVLQVAERDSSTPPAPETLFAEGQIEGGQFRKTKAKDVIKLPSKKKCFTKRRPIRIRIGKRNDARIRSASLFVNGKRTGSLKLKQFGKSVPVKVRQVSKIKVTVKVKLSNGQTLKITRTYKRCKTRRKRG